MPEQDCSEWADREVSHSGRRLAAGEYQSPCRRLRLTDQAISRRGFSQVSVRGLRSLSVSTRRPPAIACAQLKSHCLPL